MVRRLNSQLAKYCFAILALSLVGTFAIHAVATRASGGSAAAASVFISDDGSDSATNCKRYSTPQTSPPSRSTVCRSASKAYSLAQLGDTVWVMSGDYTDSSVSFETGTTTSKSLAGTNCDITKQCVYFMPQPGQEANVLTNSMGFKATHTPDHIYYKNFQVGACPSFSPANFGDTTGYGSDITIDNFKAVTGTGAACTPAIVGPWKYLRIINSEFSYTCVSGTAGGFPIQSDQSGFGGEADNHVYAPDHLLLDHNYIHDYLVAGCNGGHQDCLHIYAMTNSVISNNTFNKCYDSSILAEGLDENGFNENNIIENNWFGPTILGSNNCCFRGAAPQEDPATETFDGWTVRFNSSVDFINNKTRNVLNNVSFTGNVALGSQECASTSMTNVTFADNVFGSSPCSGSDTGSATNSSVKFVSTSGSSLNLHLQAGSAALAKVPLSQTKGCSLVSGGKDKDGQARPVRAFATTCDAGADEYMPASSRYVSITGSDTANNCSNPASPCLTFDRAYQQSSPGEVVEVASGNYPEQIINPNAGRDNDTAADVIFKPATGFSGSVNWITVYGYHLEFQDFSGDGWYVKPGAHHVTFRNMDVDLVFATSASYVNILGGDIGPYHNNSSQFKNETDSTGVQANHLVIDGVRFHDYSRDMGVGVHTECLALWGWTDVVVRNSTFSRCAVMDIAMTEAGFGNDGWHIKNVLMENNVFESPFNPTINDYDGSYSIQTGTGHNPDNIMENVTFRNNVFQSALLIDHTDLNEFPADTPTYTNVKVVNNVGSLSGTHLCQTGVTYSHNVWSVAECNPSDLGQNFTDANSDSIDDVTGKSRDETLGWINSAVGNFRPTNVSPTTDAGDATNYAVNDMDRNTRYAGSGVDVGPYEVGAIGGGSVSSVSGSSSSSGDTEAPAVGFGTPPIDGATVNGTVSLSATASDNVGVIGVTFRVDGTTIGAEDQAAPYGISWNSSLLADGLHTLTATARDAAGNTATDSITVTVTGGTNILLGIQTLGNQGDQISTNQAEAWPFTAIGTGAAGTVTLYLNGGTVNPSTAQQVLVGLYSDLAGSPKTRLATATIAAPVAGDWNNVVFSSHPSITTGTKYWIVVMGTGSGNVVVSNINNNSATCQPKVSGANDWTSLKPDFGAPSSASIDDCPLSAYVTASTVLPGDLDANGVVDQGDVNLLKADYGKATGSATTPTADLNGDGKIDVRDLSMLLRHWTG